jgi:ABC-type Fe3+/spermidine/putrescine transport system ATPase subunit
VIRELAVTTVFVTHDQQEAFALADRVAILNAGICRQVGYPEEVYNRPADAFVARFLGKANLLPAKCAGMEADQCLLEIAPGMRLMWEGQVSGHVDDFLVFVRPEDVILLGTVPSVREQDHPGPSTFSTTVRKAIFEGSIVNYTLDLNGVIVNSRHFHHGQQHFQPGDKVQIQLRNFHVMAAQ